MQVWVIYGVDTGRDSFLFGVYSDYGKAKERMDHIGEGFPGVELSIQPVQTDSPMALWLSADAPE